MASFGRNFGSIKNDLMTCPYNICHRVKPSKYQSHISKCEQTFGKSFKVCPFNANHRISSDQYKNHLISCVDNLQIFKRIQLNQTLKQQKTENAFKPNVHKWKTEDIWSDEYLNDEEKKEHTNPAFNEVLSKQQLTAEEVFDMTYGSNGSKNTFTDAIYLSRMSNEERRKFNQLVVNKVKEKDINSNKVANYGEKQEIESNRKKAKVIEIENEERDESVVPTVFRAPTTLPFPKIDLKKKMGIGRGFNSQSK